MLIRRSSSRMLSVYSSTRRRSPALKSFLNAPSSCVTESRMLAFCFLPLVRSSAFVPSPKRRSKATRGLISVGRGVVAFGQDIELVEAQLYPQLQLPKFVV